VKPACSLGFCKERKASHSNDANYHRSYGTSLGVGDTTAICRFGAGIGFSIANPTASAAYDSGWVTIRRALPLL
jgi:hypothetical protein